MSRQRIVSIGVLLLGLIVPGADAADKEAGQLKGKWLAVKGTRDGKPLAKEELARFKIMLGNKGGGTGWQDPLGGTSDPFHGHGITFDLSTSPNRLFMIRSIGLKATTYPGIFKLDGDRLIVCWNLEPWTSPKGPAMRPVPKEFAAPKGSGLVLLEFAKVKE
jgi:uncharacterized protein (TIGR03067 family)